MGDFSMSGGPPPLRNGFDLASVRGVPVTSSATVNTVGAYAEIVSAANNTDPTEDLSIVLRGRTHIADFLVTLALGEAGSEIDIIKDVWTYTSASQEVTTDFSLRLKIPSGVRISAKCQSNVASAEIDVMIQRSKLSFQGNLGFSGVTTIGANTSTTSGVLVARSSGGVYGAWVEMTPALSRNVNGFIVAAHRKGVASWTSGRVSYQVGVGTVGSEEVISEGFIGISGAELSYLSISGHRDVRIGAGQRIAIRAVSDAANTDFDLNYVLYGVN